MSSAFAAARPGAHGFNNTPCGNGIQFGVTLWMYYSRICIFFTNNPYKALLKKIPDAEGSTAKP